MCQGPELTASRGFGFTWCKKKTGYMRLEKDEGEHGETEEGGDK